MVVCWKVLKSPRVREYLDMVGQDPKGDQSPGRASGRTQGLEQELPGIKAPLFLCRWVVGGFFGWVFVGWVVVG